MAGRNIINIILDLDVKQFEKAINGAVFSLNRLGNKLESAGRDLTTRLTLPLGLAGAAAVKTFLEFDKLEKGLVVFAGSTEAAQKQLDGLKNVVLDTRTTIGFQDAVQGALRLQSIGFSADQAREALRQLGIATTASGKSSEDLGEVVNQLTQIIGRGKVLQQDIRVILDRLPVLSAVFQETFGGVSAEAIRQSTTGVGDFAAKLLTAIQQGEKFGRVQLSAAKSVETFKESSQLALAEIGRTIFNSLRLDEVLNALSGTINNLVTGFKTLSPQTQRLITTFAAFAVAIGPVLIALGAIAKLIPLLVAGFSSIGLAAGVFAAAFGGIFLAVGKLAEEFDDLGKALAFVEAKLVKTGTLAREVFKGFAAEIGNASAALGALLAKDFAGVAAALSKPGFSFVAAQEKANEAFENSLRDYVRKRNEAFTEQRRIIQESQRFDFSSLATQLTQSGGTTLEEALLSQANYFKSQNQRSPVPDLAPLPGFQGLSSQLKGLSDQFFKLPAQVKSTTAEVEKLQSTLQTTQNPAVGLKGRITEILQESQALGRSVEDQYGAIIQEIESTITSVTQQFGAQSAVLPQLIEYLDAYKSGFENLAQQQERQAQAAQLFVDVIGTIGSSFADAISGAITFGKALRNVLKEAIALTVQLVVAEAVKTSLQSSKALGPFAIPISIAAGAAAGNLLKALLSRISLAEGGIVSGETLVRVGEYPGAKTNPEVIAPLDKLKNLIGGGGDYIAEARISGDDLLLLVSRAERRLNRIR